MHFKMKWTCLIAMCALQVRCILFKATNLQIFYINHVYHALEKKQYPRTQEHEKGCQDLR